MKKRTLLWLVLALVIFGGGAWMAQETNLFGGITLSPRAKQLAYLKEHEEEIKEFVKSLNPKVESVQIDWDETQKSDGGLTTPEYYMNVFGRINHIENSGWGVDFPINDDQSINLREMFMLHEPTIGGKPIS